MTSLVLAENQVTAKARIGPPLSRRHTPEDRMTSSFPPGSRGNMRPACGAFRPTAMSAPTSERFDRPLRSGLGVGL